MGGANKPMILVSEEVADGLMQLARLVPKLVEQLEHKDVEISELKLGIQHYTRQQVADLFGVSVRSIDKWVSDGRLHPTVFGQSSQSGVRFSFAELKRFITDNKDDMSSPPADILAAAMPSRKRR